MRCLWSRSKKLEIKSQKAEIRSKKPRRGELLVAEGWSPPPNSHRQPSKSVKNTIKQPNHTIIYGDIAVSLQEWQKSPLLSSVRYQAVLATAFWSRIWRTILLEIKTYSFRTGITFTISCFSRKAKVGLPSILTSLRSSLGKCISWLRGRFTPGLLLMM